MSDLSGLIVAGKYHVIQAIGQGGMGAVYDAVHAKTGRRVALKLIHERTITSGGPAARKRFEREARATAAIDSLHVVQVLDSGEDERSGMPFIVMEFLQGVDLRTLLSNGPLPEELAITIAAQISMGLHKAHEGDVIHRDLKPANVFVAKADGGRRIIKLLDFGIAKIASEGISETVDLTSTGDLVGSPPYMSPEQLCSPRDVDPRTDVWSLGVVLYEMLCGEVPTHGVNPIGRRVYAICHVPAARIEERVPGISPKLAAIVHRALAIDPRMRFGSALEMHRELRSLIRAGGSIDLRDTDLAAHAPNLIDATARPTMMTSVPTPSGPDGASSSGSTTALGFVTVRSTPPPFAPQSTFSSMASGVRGYILAGVATAGVLASLGVASMLASPSAPTDAPSVAAASLAPPPAAPTTAISAASTTAEPPPPPPVASPQPITSTRSSTPKKATGARSTSTKHASAPSSSSSSSSSSSPASTDSREKL